MSMGPSTLLVRADASARMGQGHVMRTLALAQAWQDRGGEVAYACREIPASLAQRLRQEKMALHRLEVEPGTLADAEACLELVRRLGAAWLVADGYAFGAEFQRAVKEGGARLLVLDDYGHAEHYFADLVLNQNLGAAEEIYRRREPHTRLLLGSDYALLRREFLQARPARRHHPGVARRVLVTLGGADFLGLTPRVLDALEDVSWELEILVAVGQSNPRRGELEARAGGSRHRLRMDSGVFMPEAMAWAELCISAAGSTCWELCFMGCPAGLWICADNQRDIARNLERAGCALCWGEGEDLDENDFLNNFLRISRDNRLRSMLSRRASGLVDGHGVKRILNVMGTPDEISFLRQ